MRCEECYSEVKRITPLLKGKDCLSNHTQYICGTCGRCICMGETDKGLMRWNFPFQSLDQAMLYLRTGDITCKRPCGIYEIQNEKGRISYKIFESVQTKDAYLMKHKNKIIISEAPLFQMKKYKEYEHTQIRKLESDEVEQYTKEQALFK